MKKRNNAKNLFPKKEINYSNDNININSNYIFDTKKSYVKLPMLESFINCKYKINNINIYL